MNATRFPGCSGDCGQGRQDCTCPAAFGMCDVERDHPWVTLLYAAALVGAIVASMFYPWGFAP